MSKYLTMESRPFLPEDIVLHILLRLPFDSLLNCKRVSKKWKSLINNPSFCNLYKPRSSIILRHDKDNLRCLMINNTKTNTNPGIIVEGEEHPPYTLHCLPLPIEYKRPTVPDEEDDYFVLLSGTSNAVSCLLLHTGDFLIYNLLNGYHFTIKDAPLRNHKNSNEWWRWCCFGFGYDSHDKDYKIMVVVQNKSLRKVGKKLKTDSKTVQNEENSLFWVLSLKNLDWKRVQGFPFAKYDLSSEKEGCSLNGVLHWVVYKRGSKEVVILSCDLRTCEFGEVSVPSKSSCSKGYLCELDGHLCYWIEMMEDGKTKTAVWVMKESWTHLISVNKDYCRGRKPKGLYECQNGTKGVLFECNSGYLYWCKFDRGNEKVVKDKHKRWHKRRGKEEIRKQAHLTYIRRYLLD